MVRGLSRTLQFLMFFPVSPFQCVSPTGRREAAADVYIVRLGLHIADGKTSKQSHHMFELDTR